MDQADACGLVLNQDQVRALGISAFPVAGAVFVQHLGLEVREAQMLSPGLEQQHRHGAIGGLEHAPYSAGGRVVVLLLAECAVEADHDVLKLGQRLAIGPELEHGPGDHLAILEIDHLPKHLLGIELGPAILLKLLGERGCQVLAVGIG